MLIPRDFLGFIRRQAQRVFSSTPQGRNKQRRYIADFLRSGSLVFIGAGAADFLKIFGGVSVFGPAVAVSVVSLGLGMALMGLYVVGSEEAEDEDEEA